MIQRRLVKRPHFHLHFTPTSASWLNPVERWFGELTEKQIRRRSHLGVNQLELYYAGYFAKFADICKWRQASFAEARAEKRVRTKLAGLLFIETAPHFGTKKPTHAVACPLHHCTADCQYAADTQSWTITEDTGTSTHAHVNNTRDRPRTIPLSILGKKASKLLSL
jgi:hypothetical protein